MATPRTGLSAARRYLEVFEGSWKADHDEAMGCRQFEEMLAEAVKVFELIEGLVHSSREAVFRGLAEPNPELGEDEKAIYSGWLALIEPALPQLEGLEKTFGVVEGAERFRACYRQARSFLANWRPALPSTAVGLRAHELSEEDADELRALVEQPGGVGRPRWEPRSIPDGDSSTLR